MHYIRQGDDWVHASDSVSTSTVRVASASGTTLPSTTVLPVSATAEPATPEPPPQAPVVPPEPHRRRSSTHKLVLCLLHICQRVERDVHSIDRRLTDLEARFPPPSPQAD